MYVNRNVIRIQNPERVGAFKRCAVSVILLFTSNNSQGVNIYN